MAMAESCLSDENLASYLEDGLQAGFRATTEGHLVKCKKCKKRLSFLMKLLDGNESAEETEILDLVEGLPGRGKVVVDTPKRAYWKYAALLVVAFVTTLLLVTQSSYWSDHPAYRELLETSRPFEARLSDQPHNPLIQQRGLAESDVDYDLVAQDMLSSASSFDLGRFYLLRLDFTNAAQYLQESLLESDTAAAHNDLGVVHLEGPDHQSLRKAIGEFELATQMDPTFAPAIFNLAICYERLGDRASEESFWRQYLLIDSRSRWATEVRDRLTARLGR